MVHGDGTKSMHPFSYEPEVAMDEPDEIPEVLNTKKDTNPWITTTKLGPMMDGIDDFEDLQIFSKSLNKQQSSSKKSLLEPPQTLKRPSSPKPGSNQPASKTDPTTRQSNSSTKIINPSLSSSDNDGPFHSRRGSFSSLEFKPSSSFVPVKPSLSNPKITPGVSTVTKTSASGLMTKHSTLPTNQKPFLVKKTQIDTEDDEIEEEFY